jgi:hypothetical protein
VFEGVCNCGGFVRDECMYTDDHFNKEQTQSYYNYSCKRRQLGNF